MQAGFDVPCDHCGQHDVDLRVFACDIFDPSTYEPLVVRLCGFCRHEMRLRLHDFTRVVPPIPGASHRTSAGKRSKHIVRGRARRLA
jgi:hypothetical protein